MKIITPSHSTTLKRNVAHVGDTTAQVSVAHVGGVLSRRSTTNIRRAQYLILESSCAMRMRCCAHAGKNAWVKKETHDDVTQLETLDPASPWSNYSEASALPPPARASARSVHLCTVFLPLAHTSRTPLPCLLTGSVWQPHSGMDHQVGQIETTTILCIRRHEWSSPGRGTRAVASPSHDRTDGAGAANAQLQHAGRSVGRWVGWLDGRSVGW